MNKKLYTILQCKFTSLVMLELSCRTLRCSAIQVVQILAGLAIPLLNIYTIIFATCTILIE